MTQGLTDPRIAAGMATQLAARRIRIDAGEKPLGWKVGFGAPAALTKFGLTAPLVGYMMARALVVSGETVSLVGWAKPVAEPEIVVHIGTTVEPGGDAAAAAAAIVALGPAIELADLDSSPEDVEAILSGNIYHRRVVLGPCDPTRAGGRLDGLTARVTRRGAEIAQTTALEANTGRIVDIVRHVADALGACGECLSAGHVIICGSVVPPLMVEPDEREIAFALDPLGSVSVRLA